MHARERDEVTRLRSPSCMPSGPQSSCPHSAPATSCAIQYILHNMHRKRLITVQWTPSPENVPTIVRKPITNADLQSLKTLIKATYGWEPQDFQLEGIRAQLEGIDIIIQAPTGAGKTAIAAGPHLILKGVTIIATPLIVLAEEMVSVCTHIPNKNDLNSIKGQDLSCNFRAQGRRYSQSEQRPHGRSH